MTGNPSRLHCIICSGELAAARIMGLSRCTVCGFLTADLQIPDAELSRIYGHEYFNGSEYLDYAAEAGSLALNFERRIRVLKMLAPDLASADLLDIGCAYGYFLQTVAPHIRRASGIDISATAIDYAVNRLNLDAVAHDYLTFNLGRKVDIITMWDTIEHLKRPDLYIHKAAQDLHAGGLLAITTGDSGSLNARLRGKSWRMIHPPTHLHYFSTDTLCALLASHGFEVVHISHPGNSRKLRSILYFLTVLKGVRRNWYDLTQNLPFFDLSVTVNLFDIMYVVARRQNGAPIV